jgi:hypothetical protein
MGGVTAAGAEAQPEAPRSVITRYGKIIFRGFYEKIRGQNNTLPS